MSLDKEAPFNPVVHDDPQYHRIGSGLFIPSSVATLDLGAASLGTSPIVAREDHKHALDTTSLDGRYVLKAGDTMTGRLTISPAAENPPTTGALIIPANTSASNERAAEDLGSWRVGQDSAANNTKDFFISDLVAAAIRFQIDTSGRMSLGATAPTTVPVLIDRSGTTYTDPNNHDGAGLQIRNSANSAGAVANLALKVGGANAFDPFISFDVSGVGGYALGVDNSDNDNFKLSNYFGDVGSGNTLLHMTSAGVFSRDGTADDVFHYGAVAKRTTQYTNNTVTPSDVTGISWAVASGITYNFRIFIIFQSAATTTGIGFNFTAPAMTIANWGGKIREGAAGIGTAFREDSFANLASNFMSLNTPTANTDYLAVLEGICTPSANGTVQLQARSEVAASQITIQAGSSGVLWKIG